MIERPYYLDRLKRHRGEGLAKVLTGMRRAGKSGILRLLAQSLREEGVGTDAIVLVNLEHPSSEHLRDARDLGAYLRSARAEEQTTYVLIDEAQEVPGIGRVVRGLMDDGGFDVYLTGSHTRLVQRELADVMDGRYVEIRVYPLSFAEYRQAHATRAGGASDAALFQRYLTTGGLPYALALEDDDYALRDYLDGVYHTVLRRDVAASLGHEDPSVLDGIARQLLAGIGQPTSANGISRALTASGRSCTDDTVARYVGALSDAYAFHRMRRLDLRTKVVLKSQEKVYADDLGMRTLLLGPSAPSLAGLLENVVYLELCRRFSHARVYAGKRYARVISFVAQGRDGLEYFQVAPSVLNPQVLEAQLAPLRAERNSYPKTLLTLDEVGLASHEGIRQRNLVEWLLA